MTFSVPCPSASGARYLTINELKKSETGRNQKKLGCSDPNPVLQFKIFRKNDTDPPTITPAIVARNTHLMMLKKRTVDSVNDFLMIFPLSGNVSVTSCSIYGVPSHNKLT